MLRQYSRILPKVGFGGELDEAKSAQGLSKRKSEQVAHGRETDHHSPLSPPLNVNSVKNY